MRTALGDERGLIHKRGSFFRKIGKKIIGSVPVVGGLATGIGEAVGFFDGGTRLPPPDVFRRGRLPPAALIPQTTVVPGSAFAPTSFGGRQLGGCPPGFVSIGGRCIPTSIPSVLSDPRAIGQLAGPEGFNGGDAFVGPLQPDQFGEARVGRFGAGLEPFTVSRLTRKCPTGSVLGKVEADGSFLCYNRRDISNRERKWPRGRRPLLTGGEMRCISVASSAAKKLQRKQKQLEQLGLLKRPSRARRALPAGHVAQIRHGSEH